MDEYDNYSDYHFHPSVGEMNNTLIKLIVGLLLIISGLIKETTITKIGLIKLIRMNLRDHGFTLKVSKEFVEMFFVEAETYQVFVGGILRVETVNNPPIIKANTAEVIKKGPQYQLYTVNQKVLYNDVFQFFKDHPELTKVF